MEPITFDGRVAVVTGAGGGLGRSYALELARRGARVVVNDLGTSIQGDGSDTSAADETVKEILALGGEAVANYDSVATPEGGRAIVQTALDAFGTVDIVINNAGILRDRSFAKLERAELQAVVDVHLLGAFHVTQPAFRVMKEKRYGRLVFTASAAGFWGNFGQSNYAAAKLGLVGLSNVLAIEGAPYNITSNVIGPGAKSRLSMDMLGDAADAFDPGYVMPLVVYLVSEANDLTHQVFSASGGRYARVFIGLTPGWSVEDGTMPSVEEVGARMAEIRDLDGFVVPERIEDEMEIAFKGKG